MICIIDDLAQPGFLWPYFKELDAFLCNMTRELRKQRHERSGSSKKEKSKSRRPCKCQNDLQRCLLFSRRKDVDATTGRSKNGYLRSVIYIAYATVEVQVYLTKTIR